MITANALSPISRTPCGAVPKPTQTSKKRPDPPIHAAPYPTAKPFSSPTILPAPFLYPESNALLAHTVSALPAQRGLVQPAV